jgi:hypothetical protein
MSIINLSNRANVEIGIFCRIDVPDYEVLRFSDYFQDVTIAGELYLAMGTLLNVADVVNEITPTTGTMSITLSGIPNTSLQEILGIKLRGSRVDIQRQFFDAVTHQKINIAGNPVGRFQGWVNNFTLEEEYSQATQTAQNVMVIECTNVVDQLQNKVTGRRTNPTDQKRFFPNDLSMDRVLSLARSNLNFGAPFE